MKQELRGLFTPLSCKNPIAYNGDSRFAFVAQTPLRCLANATPHDAHIRSLASQPLVDNASDDQEAYRNTMSAFTEPVHLQGTARAWLTEWIA